jgi:hypothetical protein
VLTPYSFDYGFSWLTVLADAPPPAFPDAQYSTHHMGMAFEPASEGEVYLICQGSGGGYGDVLERDPELVMDDLRAGYTSPAVARETYFVAYDEESGAVDAAGTARARDDERAARLCRGQPYDEFVVGWVTPEPPSAIPFYGSWDDNEAERPDRRFDVVICESIDRIARRAYIATEIEHRLEQTGVPLLAADEPVILPGSGRKAKTATQVLTRRVKQGVAEWYVLEILEKSWGGFEMHAEAGFNIGKPCYGYQALQVPHPVPAKRAKGVKKTRLEPHPRRGPVVRKMFPWRVDEQLL